MYDYDRRVASDQGTLDAYLKGFFKRLPKLKRYAPQKIVVKSGSGSSGHGEARQHGREIWIFDKFWKLDRKTQDFVMAHEVGHYVLSEFGLSKFIQEAASLGVDVWDNLPFGQFNMEEAFADSFASYFTAPGELKSRYPQWLALVEKVKK